MMANFQFLSAHLYIHTEHSQLDRLLTPEALQVMEGHVEGGEDDDDAASVTSSQAPTQSAAHLIPGHPPVSHNVTGGPPRQHLVGSESMTPFSSWLII